MRNKNYQLDPLGMLPNPEGGGLQNPSILEQIRQILSPPPVQEGGNLASAGLSLKVLADALKNPVIRDQMTSKPGEVSEGLRKPEPSKLEPYIGPSHSTWGLPKAGEKMVSPGVTPSNPWSPGPLWKVDALKNLQEQNKEKARTSVDAGYSLSADPNIGPPLPPSIVDSKKDGSPWYKTSETPGVHFGKGMAALGDAFASAGQGKGGHLSNIIKQEQFWDSEQRKQYDAQMRAKLQETIHNATFGLKEKTLTLKKEGQESDIKIEEGKVDRQERIDKAKNELEGFNTKSGKAFMDSLVTGGGTSYALMTGPYGVDPDDYLSSHSVQMMQKEKTMLDGHRNKLKLKGASKSSTDINKNFLINTINADERKRKLAAIMFPKTFPNNTDGVDSVTAEHIDKKLDKTLLEYDKRWDKTFDKNKLYAGLEAQIESYTPLWGLIEKLNGLEKGSLDPNLLRVNVANNTVDYLGFKNKRMTLKIPGTTVFGFRLGDKDYGIADGLSRLFTEAGFKKKVKHDVTNSEMDHALESIFGEKRLNQAGKSLTGNELKLWNKYTQQKGLTTSAAVMDTVLKMRGLMNKQMDRSKKSFLGAGKIAQEYYYMRRPKESRGAFIAKPGKTIGERMLRLYHSGEGDTKEKVRRMKADPLIQAWDLSVTNHLRNKKAAKQPYWWNRKERKVYTHEEFNALGHPDTGDFLHQDRWKEIQTFYDFSKRFQGSK